MMMSAPSAWTARTVQLFTDSPSMCTVHAPHDDVSQPMLVPVSPTCSRMYWTSKVRGSTSCVCCSPLTVTLISTEWPPSKVKRCPCVIMTRGSGTAESAVALSRAAAGRGSARRRSGGSSPAGSRSSRCGPLRRRGSAASSSRVPLSPFGDARRDAVVEALDGGVLELEVELQLLGDGLADAHREQALHVRHAVEVEDPLDHDVGVLHLVDRLVAAVLGEAVVAPVRAHLRVDEVLVDRRQLRGEHVVEELDDVGVTLHVQHPRGARRAAAIMILRSGRPLSRAKGRHAVAS